MLRAYEAFLFKKGTIKSQYVPFYLKWVHDCYSSLNEPLSDRLGAERKKQFLSEMAKQHEDWQVKQADTALRLYDYFLSKNVMPAIAEPSSASSPIEKWEPVQGLISRGTSLAPEVWSLVSELPSIKRLGWNRNSWHLNGSEAEERAPDVKSTGSGYERGFKDY